jgi:hypothetical protein
LFKLFLAIHIRGRAILFRRLELIFFENRMVSKKFPYPSLTDYSHTVRSAKGKQI